MGHVSAKNSALQESEDDLDLSEADFAPARCNMLSKPHAINGNEFDSPTFNMAVSNLVGDAHLVGDSGPFSSHLNMTSGSIRNAEANATANASVHYDAIGLPLCTENVASDCDEALASQSCVLSSEDLAAKSNINSNNHLVEHDVDGDVMSSGNTLQDEAVTTEGISSPPTDSSANSTAASCRQIACGHGKELDSSLQFDKNITCENSDAVESLDVCQGNSVSSSMNAHDLECKTDSTVETVKQDIETINWNVNGAHLPAGEFQGMSVPSTYDGSLSSLQAMVQEEVTVIEDGDSCPAQSYLMMKNDMDEVDDGIDEVDKTVPNLYRMHHSAAFTNRTSEAGEMPHENEHTSDYNEKPTPLAGSESSWAEKDIDETRGIDRVERITSAGDFSRSRVKLKIDSCTEEFCVDEDFSGAEFGFVSNLVTDASKKLEMNDRSITEHIACETDSCGTDSLTGSMPMQSDVQFPNNTEHPASPLPCSVFAVSAVAADVTEAELSPSVEKSADVADSVCDVPVHDRQSCVDTSESLEKRVNEESSVSHVSVDSLAVRDVIQQDNQPLTANDAAGDAQNAESQQKLSIPSDTDGDNNLSDSIAADTEPSAKSKMMLTEEISAVELNSGPSLEKVDLKTQCNAASSTGPDVQEVDLSASAEREEEHKHCGLSNNVMPNTGLSEVAGQEHSQLNDTVSSECLSVSHAVDNSTFNADTSNGITEIDMPAVDTYVETQTKLTDGMAVEDQQETDTKMQSDEDAEKWFEEQFAACEDFNVEEFVSSAWSAFHADAANSEPAAGNIYEEVLEQNLAAAGDHVPIYVDTADSWHHVECAPVAASSVDDLQSPSSEEHSQYLDNEMEAPSHHTSSFQPEVPQPVPSVPSNCVVN